MNQENQIDQGILTTKHGVLQMIHPDKGCQNDQQQEQQQEQEQQKQVPMVEQLQVLLRIDPNYNDVSPYSRNCNITSRFFPCTISDQDHTISNAIVYLGPEVEHLFKLLLQKKKTWAAVVSVKAYITSQCNIRLDGTSSSGATNSTTVNANCITTGSSSTAAAAATTRTGNDLLLDEEKKRPFVCITSFDVISELLDSSTTAIKIESLESQGQKQNQSRKQENTLQNNKRQRKNTATQPSVTDRITNLSSLHPPTSFKVITSGKIGTFVLRDVWFYSDEELAGLQTCHVFGMRPNTGDIDIISSFLSNHGAMVTISSEKGSSTPYFIALKEFSEAQNKRQNASLVSNSGKEGVVRSQLVEQNYASTLALVLAHARDSSRPKLTVETLCQWHSVLGSDGLIKDAGVIRKKQVRAGVTTFCHYNVVESELGNLLMGLEELERRLLTLVMMARTSNTMMGSSDTNNSSCNISYNEERRNSMVLEKQGYGPILFAVVAMFGVVDIHPFSDGNGRLSRLIANWALTRAGFPFTVNLFATPAQRRRYVTAVEMTRRNTNIIARGMVSLEILSTVRRHIGLFKPLFDFLLSVLAKAITECRKVIDDTDRLHLEEEELRIARRYRERAAAGSCLICFEDYPNIATLCCGKAVHINCIAQWLSNNRSCPQCRSDLPSVPPAIVRPATGIGMASGANNREMITTTDVTDIFDDVDDTTSTHEEDVDDTTSAHIEDMYETTSTHEEEDVDDTTSAQVEDMNDTTSTHEEEQVDDTTSTDEDTTMYDTSTMGDMMPFESQPSARRCGYASCSNRAAMDCANDYCGRCCQIFGYNSCTRHSLRL